MPGRIVVAKESEICKHCKALPDEEHGYGCPEKHKPKVQLDLNNGLLGKINRLERERNMLLYALRTMSTAGSVLSGDLFGDAYLNAGGGYEGLQAIATEAIKLAEEME